LDTTVGLRHRFQLPRAGAIETRTRPVGYRPAVDCQGPCNCLALDAVPTCRRGIVRAATGRIIERNRRAPTVDRVTYAAQEALGARHHLRATGRSRALRSHAAVAATLGSLDDRDCRGPQLMQTRSPVMSLASERRASIPRGPEKEDSMPVFVKFTRFKEGP
jgi:hypothetical protein